MLDFRVLAVFCVPVSGAVLKLLMRVAYSGSVNVPRRLDAKFTKAMTLMGLNKVAEADDPKPTNAAVDSVCMQASGENGGEMDNKCNGGAKGIKVAGDSQKFNGKDGGGDHADNSGKCIDAALPLDVARNGDKCDGEANGLALDSNGPIDKFSDEVNTKDIAIAAESAASSSEEKCTGQGNGMDPADVVIGSAEGGDKGNDEAEDDKTCDHYEDDKRCGSKANAIIVAGGRNKEHCETEISTIADRP